MFYLSTNRSYPVIVTKSELEMPKTRRFSNHIENNLGEEHQYLLDIHVYSELPKYSTTEGKNVTDSTENH